jgi:hypothetical protein
MSFQKPHRRTTPDFLSLLSAAILVPKQAYCDASLAEGPASGRRAQVPPTDLPAGRVVVTRLPFRHRRPSLSPCLVAYANRDIRTPASRRGDQHRSGCRRVDMVHDASTPRRNTCCHGFHANRR